MDSRFEWRDTYALGIPVVDAEHRRFFDILDGLERLASAESHPAEVRIRIGQLMNYAREHFAHEEEFLDAVGCPGLDEHAAEHRSYVDELNRFALQRDVSAAATLDFARGWLVAHLLGTDRTYQRWLDGALEPARLEEALQSYGA